MKQGALGGAGWDGMRIHMAIPIWGVYWIITLKKKTLYEYLRHGFFYGS